MVLCILFTTSSILFKKIKNTYLLGKFDTNVIELFSKNQVGTDLTGFFTTNAVVVGGNII